MVEKLQKTCKALQMDIALRAREMVVAIAGPRYAGETIPRLLERAARKLGFSFARTKNIYHQRARRIDAAEWERLKEAVVDLQQGAAKRWEIINELESRIAPRSEGGSQDARGSSAAIATVGRPSDRGSPSSVRAGERSAVAGGPPVGDE